MRTIIKIATPVLSLLLSSQANAMQALGDKDLSDITGQAFITVDTSSYTDSTYGNYEFARINLGVDIEIQANADSVKIGTFEREYGSEGTAPLIDVAFASNGDRNVSYQRDENGNIKVNGSDLQLDNLGLGRIDNAYGDNPTMPSPVAPSSRFSSDSIRVSPAMASARQSNQPPVFVSTQAF